jgi:hypothetical protein
LTPGSLTSASRIADRLAADACQVDCEEIDLHAEHADCERNHHPEFGRRQLHLSTVKRMAVPDSLR